MTTYNEGNQYSRKHIPDRVNEELDPLTLDISDDELVVAIERRIQAADKFYNSEDIQLKKRRRKNKDFLRGRQKPSRELKKHQTEYNDNLIFEAEATIKPIALSRLPDLLVKPAKDTPESKSLALDLTKLVNSDIRKRENRRTLGIAWKHVPVYFVGVIKPYWDANESKYGDYKFRFVHPEKITIDHTAATPYDSDLVDEEVDMTVQEMIMRWPKKEKQIKDACGITDLSGVEKLASMVTLHEVWFKWWKKPKPGEEKWTEVNAVCWKFKKLILDKMRNPYWDWEGQEKLFDEAGNSLGLQDLSNVLLGSVEAQTKKTFNNYFTRPEFPYIFLVYDQWGEYPIDYTSRIEQSLSLQENHNKRGLQISDMNDRARGKHIFSTKSGLDKKDISKLDMDNPFQDLVVSGPINEAHTYIQSPPAPQQMFEELSMDREHLFSKMGTNATTRGERSPNETATGLQIYREADFGRIDDMVEDTINSAAEKMGAWALQFIKLFYDEEHMVSFLGPDGSVTFRNFTRDAIEDGMEVVVSASGVDRMLAKKEAYERARLQLTDPLTFFIDVGASDPKGRAEKLMLFGSAPELYLQQFIKGQTTKQMAQTISNPTNIQSPETQTRPIETPAQ